MESCFVTSMEAQDDNSAGLDELWNVISKEGVNINSRSVTTASSVTDSKLYVNH